MHLVFFNIEPQECLQLLQVCHSNMGSIGYNKQQYKSPVYLSIKCHAITEQHNYLFVYKEHVVD